MSRGVGTPLPVVDLGTLEAEEKAFQPFAAGAVWSTSFNMASLADRNQLATAGPFGPPATGPMLSVVVQVAQILGVGVGSCTITLVEANILNAGMGVAAFTIANPPIFCPVGACTVIRYAAASALVGAILTNVSANPFNVNYGAYLRSRG